LRLAAIAHYDVVETEAEEAFDEIAFIASQVCHAPIALISLMDRDRERFKARMGFELAELPLEHAICRHGLASTELMSIPDLSRDARTMANPLVLEGPRLRFYAGAPLITPAGVIIGMLSVVDSVPRPGGLCPKQRRMLLALAAQTIVQLELRAVTRRGMRELQLERTQSAMLRRAAERLELAEEAGNVGAFELDAATGTIAVSDECCRLYGLEPRSSLQLEELTTHRIVRAEESFAALMLVDRGEPISHDFEIMRPSDGERRWLHLRGRWIEEDDGRDLFIGMMSDVTEQRAVNEEIAHRLKNTLALVQAIAGQTLKHLPDQSAVREFDKRITALGTAHEILLSGTQGSASLHKVARGVFSRLATGGSIEVKGRDVVIGSRSVLILSMMLHELATNAIKYGAASVPGGTATLTSTIEMGGASGNGPAWEQGTDDNGPDNQGQVEMLVLDWREEGGPRVVEPTTRGLGTRLIERGLDASGEVKLEFAPGGLRARITAPIERFAR